MLEGRPVVPTVSFDRLILHFLGSSFRIPYHTSFQWGTFKEWPITYTVSGGNGRVF